MKTRNVLTVAAAAAVAFFAQSTIAQPASAPASRAEVKAGAQAKNDTPPGQGPGTATSSQAGTAPGAMPKPAGTAVGTGPTTGSKAGMSDTTRMERKSDARDATGTAATKAGENPLPRNATTQAHTGGGGKAGHMDKAHSDKAGSTTTRQERKAETRSANKAGEIRNGEAPRPLSEPAKK